MNLSPEAWEVAREHVDWLVRNKVSQQQALEALVPGFSEYLPGAQLGYLDLAIAFAIAWTKMQAPAPDLRLVA